MSNLMIWTILLDTMIFHRSSRWSLKMDQQQKREKKTIPLFWYLKKEWLVMIWTSTFYHFIFITLTDIHWVEWIDIMWWFVSFHLISSRLVSSHLISFNIHHHQYRTMYFNRNEIGVKRVQDTLSPQSITVIMLISIQKPSHYSFIYP